MKCGATKPTDHSSCGLRRCVVQIALKSVSTVLLSHFAIFYVFSFGIFFLYLKFEMCIKTGGCEKL